MKAKRKSKMLFMRWKARPWNDSEQLWNLSFFLIYHSLDKNAKYCMNTLSHFLSTLGKAPQHFISTLNKHETPFLCRPGLSIMRLILLTNPTVVQTSPHFTRSNPTAMKQTKLEIIYWENMTKQHSNLKSNTPICTFQKPNLLALSFSFPFFSFPFFKLFSLFSPSSILHLNQLFWPVMMI